MSALLPIHLAGPLAALLHPQLAHTGLVGLARAVVDPPPADNDVVAGWTAAVVFVLLIVGLVVICRSLVTRLKNVDKAAEQGLYDPSEEKKVNRPPRGLAARKPPTS